MASLISDYERHDAGRSLKMEKERITAHVAQIKISLSAIRAIRERYVEAEGEVDSIVNELTALVSGIV